MKIVVDEIPKEPKDCLFSEYWMTGVICGFGVEKCNPKECKYLKEEHKNIVFDNKGEK